MRIGECVLALKDQSYLLAGAKRFAQSTQISKARELLPPN
jgi:hypothetical protein